MDTAEILDWNPLPALGQFPEPKEEIIWTGSPDLLVRIPGLNTNMDLILMLRSWLYYYFLIFYLIKSGFANHTPWKMVLAIVLITFIQVIPALFEYISIKRTLYVVTNQRIILRTWRNLIERVHVLRYDDFQQVSLVGYDNATWSTIYLMTGKDVRFWTYDLQSRNRREHPTLEGIQNGQSLALRIEKIRQEHLHENLLLTRH